MTYVVQPGDTLFFIARRFGVTVEDILAANPQIIDPDLIFPGQIIEIPIPAPPPPPDLGITYIVQPGDTLFNIARQFGVPLADLIAANPQIADPNLIFPGQIIIIPVEPAPPPAPPGFNYVVQPGDTLFFIAQRFGVSLEDLIAANPQIADPNLIFPGQIILIPVQDEFPPLPPDTTTYIVQPGDTLFNIAQRFGVSLDALIAANPQIINPDLIFPGQIIIIPPVPEDVDA